LSFRVSKIDDSNRKSHFRIEEQDHCYFLSEYLSGRKFHAGVVNQFIYNLKKKPNAPGQWYKATDIAKAALHVSNALLPSTIASTTFVPIPSSKCKSDLAYDDRLVRILSAVTPALDFREVLIRQVSAAKPLHEFKHNERRPAPDQLASQLTIDHSQLTKPLKTNVILFDDLLVTGTSFKACEKLILTLLPQGLIVGLFLARAIRPSVSSGFEDAL
jgi:predicted amidophosphoribosyltransferase